VAYYALFRFDVRLLSDFLRVRAEDYTTFFIVNTYCLHSGRAAQGVDRMCDVFKSIEQHALAHGPHKHFVSVPGREDYFLHNVLPVGPDNEISKRNKHNCTDKQNKEEEPEGE
jgi:hypothetical protein